MKYLDLIKSNLILKDGELEGIKEDLEYVEKVLNKYNIIFDDMFAITFYNHIIKFIERVKSRNFVDTIEKDMVSELTEDSIKIGTELLNEIFSRYKSETNMSEVYLVSIHIQVARNKKYEEDKHYE